MFDRAVFPILPTPFHPDESVDLDSYARMVERMVALDVSGVTILGVLGEANRLTDRERTAIIECTLSTADGRIPVVVGTSHSGTRAAIELTQTAADLGAAAIMVTPHKEAVPSDEKVLTHFRAIGGATDLPIVFQDHPGSTDVHLSIDLVLRLVDELETVACIKQEALPSPPRITALRSRLSRPVPILTGLGALYGGFELLAGADGFMTGFAFPEILQAMVAADVERAWALYREYLPLMVFENQPGVAIRKEIFRRRGMIEHATVRGPAPSINAAASAQLDDVLRRMLGTADLTGRIEP